MALGKQAKTLTKQQIEFLLIQAHFSASSSIRREKHTHAVHFVWSVTHKTALMSFIGTPHTKSILIETN